MYIFILNIQSASAKDATKLKQRKGGCINVFFCFFQDPLLNEAIFTASYNSLEQLT